VVIGSIPLSGGQADLEHRAAGLVVSWRDRAAVAVDDCFHVLDLWDSPAHFENFVQQRLMPSVQKVGVDGQPKVEIFESLSVFAPNV
jgi:hypothetical protein